MNKARDRRWANIRVALCIAWAAFFVSFFLPALEADSAGWQSFLSLFMFFPLYLLAMPVIAFTFPIIIVGDIAAVLAPLSLVDKSFAWAIATFTFAGAVSGVLLPRAIGADVLLEGYYLWMLSLFGLAIVEAIAAVHMGSRE